MQDNQPQNNDWHFDKRLPLIFIIGFVTQTITLVYFGTAWKSDTDNRLTNLERTQLVNVPQEGRIIVLEQRYSFIENTLARIEKKLDDIQHK